MSYRAILSRSAVAGLGADLSDPCLAEGADAFGSQLLCNCLRQWGVDYAQKKTGTDQVGWINALIAGWNAAGEVGSAFWTPQPAPGAPPWGDLFAPFDFAGAAMRAFMSTITGGGGSACGGVYGSQKLFGNWWERTDSLSKCCSICPVLSGPLPDGVKAVCVTIDNACVHNGKPNAPTWFGGPILEYFNFRRLLWLLGNGSKELGYLSPSLLQNRTLDPNLKRALQVAHQNLNDLLGRSWPTLTRPFNQGVHDAARARLLAPKAPVSDRLLAALGHGSPFVWEAWFNRLRFLAQRVPSGDAWHCVWDMPSVAMVDPATQQPVVLYVHEPSLTLTAGEWLANVLDMLAPGWHAGALVGTGTRPLQGQDCSKYGPGYTWDPVRRRCNRPIRPGPSGAAKAVAAVAAAAGGAALLWFLL